MHSEGLENDLKSFLKDLKKDLITNNFMIFDDLVDKGNHLKSIFGASVIESVFEKVKM